MTHSCKPRCYYPLCHLIPLPLKYALAYYSSCRPDIYLSSKPSFLSVLVSRLKNEWPSQPSFQVPAIALRCVACALVPRTCTLCLSSLSHVFRSCPSVASLGHVLRVLHAPFGRVASLGSISCFADHLMMNANVMRAAVFLSSVSLFLPWRLRRRVRWPTTPMLWR